MQWLAVKKFCYQQLDDLARLARDQYWKRFALLCCVWLIIIARIELFGYWQQYQNIRQQIIHVQQQVPSDDPTYRELLTKPSMTDDRARAPPTWLAQLIDHLQYRCHANSVQLKQCADHSARRNKSRRSASEANKASHSYWKITMQMNFADLLRWLSEERHVQVQTLVLEQAPQPESSDDGSTDIGIGGLMITAEVMFS